MTSTSGQLGAPGKNRGRRTLTVVLIACVAAGVVTAVALNRRGEGANGAGLTYRGMFYHLSSVQVRPDAVGQLLDAGVPFQDRRIPLRAITGVDAGTAVTGFVPTYPGTGTTASMAWLLLSPDADLAADPGASTELRNAVAPPSPSG